MFDNFFSENQGIYEVMWKNTVQPNRPQITIWRIRMACWMLKGTNAHSEYTILIAFPLQQWLHEGASMLLYTYLHCPSYSISLWWTARVTVTKALTRNSPMLTKWSIHLVKISPVFFFWNVFVFGGLHVNLPHLTTRQLYMWGNYER